VVSKTAKLSIHLFRQQFLIDPIGLVGVSWHWRTLIAFSVAHILATLVSLTVPVSAHHNFTLLT